AFPDAKATPPLYAPPIRPKLRNDLIFDISYFIFDILYLIFYILYLIFALKLLIFSDLCKKWGGNMVRKGVIARRWGTVDDGRGNGAMGRWYLCRG
ncbi:hypothetical protein, partial [Mediterranea massiliensis]|uniref:hypothetical protein n=1 Tax=Mediterranea massiliensis TaxID=1841865 RepID=UPI00266DBF51